MVDTWGTPPAAGVGPLSAFGIHLSLRGLAEIRRTARFIKCSQIQSLCRLRAHAASCSEIRLIFVVAEWQSRKLNYFLLLKLKNKYFICFQLNIIGSSSLVSRVDIINWFFRIYQLYSKSRRGYWHNILFNTVESHQSI